MNKTKIEWVKNPDGTQGYTWNPITGCLNGCEYCYARKLANGRLKTRYLANLNLPPDARVSAKLSFREGTSELGGAYLDPFYPRFWEDRLKKIYNPIMPIGVFVCDMSDFFGIGIPEEWTRRVFEAITDRPQHRFYLLTKQPQNLIKFSPFPLNCEVGVSVTNPEMFVEACYRLKPIIAKIKFLSFEPLLNFEPRPDTLSWHHWIVQWLNLGEVKRVIIGAQTKPYGPPKIEWVEEIVRACDKAGISVFLKDNLKPLLEMLDITGTSFGRLTELKNLEPKEGPRQRDWYQLRQEMPR